jgi:hypothetical protein
MATEPPMGGGRTVGRVVGWVVLVALAALVAFLALRDPDPIHRPPERPTGPVRGPVGARPAPVTPPVVDPPTSPATAEERFRLQVSVRGPDGEAVAGARVRLRRLRAAAPSIEEVVESSTNSNGVARMAAAWRPEALGALMVSAAGLSPAAVVPVRGDDELIVTLAQGGILCGVVEDDRGSWIAGAAVAVHCLLGSDVVTVRATTLADGTFEVRGVPTHLAQAGHPAAEPVTGIEVRAAGYATAFLSHLRPLRPGERREIRLRVERGVATSVRVTDSGGGEPLPGCTVTAVGSQVGSWATVFTPHEPTGREAPAGLGRLCIATTDEAGLARLEGLPTDAGTLVRVFVLREGYAPRWLDLSVDDRQAPAPHELPLWPSLVVTGRVLFEGGTPAKGVTVSVANPATQAAEWIPASVGTTATARATTDAEGRFRIEAAPRSTERSDSAIAVYSPAVMREPGRVAEPELLEPVPLDADAEFDAGDLFLKPLAGRWTRVRVLDTNGRPVAGATVSSARAQVSPATDASGEALLPWPDDVTSGAVMVRAKGYGVACATLEAGSIGDDGTVLVISRGRTLRGTVLENGNQPAVGAAVLVANGSLPAADAFRPAIEVRPDGSLSPTYPPLRTYASVVTDAAGSFVVEDLPDGPYLVQASRHSMQADGRARRVAVSSPSTVGAAEDSVVLVLEAE